MICNLGAHDINGDVDDDDVDDAVDGDVFKSVSLRLQTFYLQLS